MTRWLVDVGNVLWLGLVFIGGPAAVSARAFGVQASSTSQSRQLILAGLTVGVAANLVVALGLAKKKPTKRRLFEWSGILAALLLIAGLEASGIIGFHWLRNVLRWIKG